MLLIPQIIYNGNLYLDAYSFSSEEIGAVASILHKAKIRHVNEELTKDTQGRYGLRFIIISGEIIKLEQTLRLKFEGRDKNTKVVFNPSYANADGQGDNDISFKCSRIDNPPYSCSTIFAKDETEAAVKCALIASQNNWLGGVPTRGRC